MSDDHAFNYHMYITESADFEYAVNVPTLTIDLDPRVVIRVAAVGGGTVGESYAGNWYYSVEVGNTEVMHGDDLYTGTPKTHAEAACIIAGFTSVIYPEGSDTYDRLALFAEDE